jgi:hypothetical protein
MDTAAARLAMRFGADHPVYPAFDKALRATYGAATVLNEYAQGVPFDEKHRAAFADKEKAFLARQREFLEAARAAVEEG